MTKKFVHLAIIVFTEDEKCFQVALDSDQSNAISRELKHCFKDGIIQIIPKEIESLGIEKIKKTK